MTINLPLLTSESELSRYLNQISNLPYLEEEEEKTLALAYSKGDIKAAEKLVTSHLRLVVKIAMNYKNYGLSLMDLVCEGNLGLMQAVKKFDVKKGFRLSTYAMWWIKAYIQDYILKSWSLVKIGTSSMQKKLFFNLGKIKHKISRYNKNDIDFIEFAAQELGVSKQDVINMDSRLSNSDASLNDLVGDEDGQSEMIDFIADQNINQETLYIENQQTDIRSTQLNQAIDELNEREQFIIKNRTPYPRILALCF